MMTELSAILQPEFVWLDLAAFAVFSVYALWAIIAGEIRVTKKQEQSATVIRRAA